MSNTFKVNAPAEEGKASAWKRSDRFPKNRYAVRCISTQFGPSNNGHAMITAEFEVCHSEPVKFGDKLLDIDGLKFTKYFMITIMEEDRETVNEEKTFKARSAFNDFLKMLNYDQEEWDVTNPPHNFLRGKVLDAVVYGKPQPSFMEPTPEEKAAGKRTGQPIKDAKGNDVISYQLDVEQFLSLSTDEVNRPY